MKRHLEKNKNQNADGSNNGWFNAVMQILRGITDKSLSSSAKFSQSFRGSEWVRFAAVLGYLLSLLLVGTFAMMALEGWNFVQGMYFSSFCMTTSTYDNTMVRNLPYSLIFCASFTRFRLEKEIITSSNVPFTSF